MKNTVVSGKLSLYFLSIFLVIIIFCTKKSSSGIIARVDNSIFTVDDLDKNIPAEYRERITPEQNINYVKQWIDAELLFQEALRRKIDREPEMKKRLEKMKKDLLSAEIISRCSLDEPVVNIDESAIHSCYELNKEKYIREKDAAKYLEIITADLRTAWYISKNATGANFSNLAAEYSQQPCAENKSVPYRPIDNLSPEIRKTIGATPVNATSVPVQSEIGYHVIHVLDKLEKGGICKEEEVHEDIVNQLTLRMRKENREKLLSDIRLKTNVEFNPDFIKTSKPSFDTN